MAKPQPSPAPQTRTQRFTRAVLDWVKSLVVIAAIMIPIRASIADWCDVPTGSMEPTILPGDRIAVNKLAYGLRVPLTEWWVTRWDRPTPGEVVILHSPKDGVRLVKRLIAGPGDTIELRNQHLYINGVASAYSNLSGRWLDETVPDHASRWPAAAFAREQISGRSHPVMAQTPQGVARTFGPITVPKGQYFVMGDNRDLSGDSRVFGFVPEEKIVGRSPGVAMSFDPDHSYAPRVDRFFLGFD